MHTETNKTTWIDKNRPKVMYIQKNDHISVVFICSWNSRNVVVARDSIIEHLSLNFFPDVSPFDREPITFCLQKKSRL